MKSLIMKLMLLILVLGLVSQTGCGSKASANGNDENKSEKKVEENEKKSERIPVEVTSVTKGDIAASILFSANLETERMVDIFPRVNGIIEDIKVEEGDFVEKGQVLLEIEPDAYELAEKRARLNYQQSEANFNRLESMFEKDLISKEDFEDAKYSLEIAHVNWEEAKLNLEYTRVTAPITGYIGERLCRPGDRIQPSDKLFLVANTDEFIAVIHVPEKELATVEKDQIAYLKSDNLGTIQFPGWVKRISPIVDANSGTFKVTVGVKNEDQILRPGMFVNVHVITEQHENTLLVPKTAVVYESDKMNVFVVRDSLAHKITLKNGFQDHEKIEVLDNLVEGEKIIVVGQSGLKDKTPVKIVAERDTL